MVVENNILSPKKLLPFFRNFFTQKWEREVDTNLEAVEKAQLLLDETLKIDLDDHAKAEVDKIQAQLDHTKQYCKWLENLSNAIESGQIFEHYPIPEKKIFKKLADFLKCKTLKNLLALYYKLSSSDFSLTCTIRNERLSISLCLSALVSSLIRSLLSVIINDIIIK